MPKPSRILNNISITLMLLLAAPCAWAGGNLIDRIHQTEKSIVTVQTQLTRVTHTNPPHLATYYRKAAGLVIDPSGIIVTNTHTIIDAPFIFVILPNGTKLSAKVLYANGAYDFSFLRIHPPHPLPSVAWADSSLVGVGQDILAVGNSDYDNRSIMSGHIKGILRDRTTLTNDFLELDLDLNHGDSGGPILDRQGRLLGMVMAKRESQPNSSIAIASNKIHQQYLQYRRNVP
ncbi:MAG: trypsin-like peptidase domain-containing protein [Candidatus Omnitrophica bacterium]|nr:trypsin-like peptidase domain-containing protein [Candidatus Omnitrophota bacterium]MDE2221921.1 trypsin-like peptidase domain-containing protein [Candidatus Omnitrophota bacterium]